MIYTISVTHLEDIRSVISYLREKGFISNNQHRGIHSDAYLDTRTSKWCILFDTSPENATAISLILGAEIRISPPEDAHFYRENLSPTENPCGEIPLQKYPPAVFKLISEA